MPGLPGPHGPRDRPPRAGWRIGRRWGLTVVGVAGASGAGKTRLVELLVPHLGDLRLGYLKHAHRGFRPGRPESDTDRVRRAGVPLVAVVGGGRFLLEGDGGIEALLAGLLASDLLLVEGASRAPWEKVVVRSPALPDRPVAGPVLTDLSADPPGAFAPQEVAALAARLRERAGQRATLLVDGRPVPLREFPASFLAGAVLGMVSALDGGGGAELILRVRASRP